MLGQGEVVGRGGSEGGKEIGKDNVVVVVTDVVIHLQIITCFSGVCVFGRAKRREGGREGVSIPYFIYVRARGPEK